MKPSRKLRQAARRIQPARVPHCGTRIRLPAGDYEIREKYLRRFRSLIESPPGADGKGEVLEGIVNVGPDEDEIWVEKTLSEAEKRYVVIHELVHARRQAGDEDFADEAVEERIVELECVARADPGLLRELPNGLLLGLLHDFLTAEGRFNPNTAGGLGRVHARISRLLGGMRTTAC